MPIEQLYFIALIPPKPIYTHALEQKEYIARQYNSRAALRSPPHITLHMPFKLSNKREEKFIDTLSNFTSGRNSFNVELDGFGSFEPRVIYMNVVKSAELADLQADLSVVMKKEFNLFNANHKGRPFHPHMTIAFRDLRKAVFYEAWAAYQNKEYQASFEADGLALLKHDGKRWDVYKRFSF